MICSSSTERFGPVRTGRAWKIISAVPGTSTDSNRPSARRITVITSRGMTITIGKHSMYRFHIEDPIYFNKSLVFSIEHGHANDRSGDWTSVAYWYQSEPHKPFLPFPAVEDRIPYRFGGRSICAEGRIDGSCRSITDRFSVVNGHWMSTDEEGKGAVFVCEGSSFCYSQKGAPR